MQTDFNLIFDGGQFSAQDLGNSTAGAYPSAGVLDLATGLMINTGSATTYGASPLTTGNAKFANGLPNFAEDLGIGDEKLPLAVYLSEAFAGGTSLNIAIQGAPDASTGTYPANLSSLSWTTYAESGAQVTAQLGVLNSKFPMPDWPHRAIEIAMPRFIRLVYTTVGSFTTGMIGFAGFVLQRNDNPVGKYPSGFSVGA